MHISQDGPQDVSQSVGFNINVEYLAKGSLFWVFRLSTESCQLSIDLPVRARTTNVYSSRSVTSSGRAAESKILYLDVPLSQLDGLAKS